MCITLPFRSLFKTDIVAFILAGLLRVYSVIVTQHAYSVQFKTSVRDLFNLPKICVTHREPRTKK